MAGRVAAACTAEVMVDGVRLVLPPRGSQGLPGMVLLPLVAGGIGVGFLALGVAVVLGAGDVPALFLLPFVLGGALFAMLGLSVRRSRSALEITRDRVTAVERFGLLRWRRSRPRAGIARALVQELAVRVNSRPVRGIGCLVLEGREAPLRAGWYYRVDTLREVAARALAELGLVSEPGELQAADVEVAAAGTAGSFAGSLDEPPRGSKARLQRNAAGLLLELPPAGFRGGGGVLLSVGAVFVVMALGMAGAFLLARQEQPGDVPFWVFLFLGLFVAVGAGMVLGGVVMARRHALVGVVQGSLLVRRIGPLGEQTHEWPPGAVHEVAVEASSYTVNNRRLPQLAIRGDGQPPLTMALGRDERELQWLAAVLRDALGIATPTPAAEEAAG